MKILFLSHDATRTGAPIVLLNFLKWLKAQKSDMEIQVLLGRGGVLEKAFSDLVEVHYWEFKKEFWNQIARGLSKLFGSFDLLAWRQKIVAWRLRRQNFDLVYGNTVLAADILNRLQLPIPTVLHIHELNYIAEHYGDMEALGKALPRTDKVIAVSELVQSFLQQQFDLEDEKVEVIYPFSEVAENGSKDSEIVVSTISENAFIVGGCGTIDWRKGTDLFIQVAQKVIAALPKKEIHFVWLGGSLEQKNYHQIAQDLRKLGLQERVHFVGSQPNPQDYFKRFNLFLMTSREDPFPLVCLENAQLGNPIICFEGATGSEIYIDDTTGRVVPYMDTEAMAEAALAFYNNQDLLQKASEKIKLAVADYTIEKSGQQILKILKELKPKSL